MAIDLTVEDAVAVITINRPERRNALDAEHYRLLSMAWEQVRDDDDIRAAIVTGAGDKAFCAGADIKSWVGREVELGALWLTQTGQLLNRGLEVWKPVIAAVNGACVGGGMTLLLATDIRVSVPSASFGLPEVTRGIVAANGGTQRLLQQLPHAIAMELLLTGDVVEAATAERWGLVNKLVPEADLMSSALDYAHRIARNAPLAVQASKELALRSRDMDVASGLRMEQLVNRILQGSEDVQTARSAFSEKRRPKFEGR